MHIIREITPLAKEDFFVVLYHPNAKFDYPTHYHPEYEINYVENAKGKRIVGESVSQYNEVDLALIGPNVYHSWQSETGAADLVVTVQFQQNIFPPGFSDKNILLPIKEMLERSNRGIVFEKRSIQQLAPLIKSLANENGFDSFLQFLNILHKMAVSANQKILCSQSFSPRLDMFKSRRIATVTKFIGDNFENKIRIDEIGNLIGMTNSSFCHFFKKRTGKSFIDYLNDVRIGHASVQLMETTKSVSEISYGCGFNNISNFNRIFKTKKGLTPGEFRKYNQQQIIKF